MEGEQYTNNINATDICLTTLDYPGLRVNLFLKSYKIPSMDSGYPGNAEDGKD